MENEPIRTDIAIAGGGLVGLTLAVALAREGMRVAVIERDDLTSQLVPAFDGRVSAIALGSQRLLNAIGVWESMEPHAEPILDIRVSDDESPIFLDYHHEDVGELPFGWIVENRHTRIALHQALARYPNISLYARDSVNAFDSDDGGIHIVLESGKTVRAALLVAAEGKQSRTRDLAGIKARRFDYKHTAIVCTIVHKKPHLGLAQERFLPAGPFAVLPMQDNRSSLVWVEPPERVGFYTGLEKAELAQEIRERTGDYLGEIRVEGDVFTYPLVLTLAETYTSGRVCLIGDAAHGIHPIAGQGVNLGFRDVGALHEVLAKRFKLGLDLGAADGLADYVRWRRFDNLTMIAVTDGLTRLFSINLPPVKLARRLGLWGIGKLPAARKFFMRHAMGTVGELPVLMQPGPR